MSKLEDYLSDELFTRFGQYSIRRNYAPDWLRETGSRLQLDFYIDELKIAAEVQGDQHYKFTPHFHKDTAGFDALQRRDRDKAYLCQKQGVELHEIFTFTDADIFICRVKEITGFNQDQKEKYSYQEEQISNRKFRRLVFFTDPKILKHRIERCQKNLLLWEQGELDVGEEKVRAWKETINNGGQKLGEDF